MGRGTGENNNDTGILRYDVSDIEAARKSIQETVEAAEAKGATVVDDMKDVIRNYRNAAEEIAEISDKTIHELLRHFQAYGDHAEECATKAGASQCDCGYEETAERVENIRRFF